MALNSCEFIGNLGKDPEIKSMQNGDKVANLSIAVSEKWKAKDGEKKERTTWVPIVIWGPLVDIAERYLRKGSKIFVRGKFSVRKWQDQSGQDRYATEIVLQGFDAKLEMLDAPKTDSGQHSSGGQSRQSDDGWGGGQSGARTGGGGSQSRFDDDLDDEVPF